MGSLYHLEINLYSRDSIVSDRDRVVAWIILSLEEDVHIDRYAFTDLPFVFRLSD